MAKNFAVIICAAGSSSRFGGKRKKPFIDVAGRAAFLHSLEIFSGRGDVKQILLAIAPEDEELVKIKWGANLKFFNVKVCFGGKERFETVSRAMELVRNDIDFVAVHDAARCCVTAEWVDKCFKAAEKTGAAILACPVVDTIKKVKDSLIIQTIDRAGLYEAQTPQVFSAAMLKRAYANIGKIDKTKISDDSQLVEALGEKVSIVETDATNIKITKHGDVAIAEAIIKELRKIVSKEPLGPFYEAQW